MSDRIKLSITVPDDYTGLRLDQALAKIITDYSRTQIQSWIKANYILVDGKAPTRRTLLLGGESIEIDAQLRAQPSWLAESIGLDILFEDESIIVLNKPAGMVVHPGSGNPDHTLLNALINHEPSLQLLPRAGIVHRLDKDTSGVLVVAKTSQAHLSLVQQLKKRTVKRVYQTIVMGTLTSGGTIEQPIGRHYKLRKKMAVTDTGKPAITHYRIVEKYRAHTRIKVQLETGRTHQIRVHMAHVNHPVLGDQTYGKLQLPKGASAELVEQIRTFKRQALHAYELGLIHPVTQEEMSWQAPMPADMINLIKILRDDT